MLNLIQQLFIDCSRARNDLTQKNNKSNDLLNGTGFEQQYVRKPEAASSLRRRNFQTQQSQVILDLCLRKPRSGKARNYRDAIVIEKLCFQNVSRPHDEKLSGVFDESSFS